VAQLEIIKTSDNNYHLSGDLIFSTIDNNIVNKLELAANKSPIHIDLQALQKIDSAGVALLIEWIKFARTHQLELLFDAIPPQLTALAKLSYLSECGLFTTQDPKING